MIPSQEGPIRTRCRATPATAPYWQRRSMDACSLRERRRRRTFSRRRTGRGIQGSGRRGKCWAFWANRNRTLVIASAAKQSRIFPQRQPGLLRCARKDELLDHPRPQVGIRYDARIILAEDAVAVARDEVVERAAQRFRHSE